MGSFLHSFVPFFAGSRVPGIQQLDPFSVFERRIFPNSLCIPPFPAVCSGTPLHSLPQAWGEQRAIFPAGFQWQYFPLSFWDYESIPVVFLNTAMANSYEAYSGGKDYIIGISYNVGILFFFSFFLSSSVEYQPMAYRGK